MLIVKNISFSYNQNKKVIRSISFNLEQGKMLSLIGESGSGKSTILKLIYGLLDWEEGDIIYNGKKLTGFKGNLVPGESEFKYLEQNFGLMPYATVGENIGKFISNIYQKEKKDRILFLLDLIEMKEYIDVKANLLSGGQQQRVALARALAQTPSVLLLDEPFSQIDTFKKNTLKRAVFDFAKENKISIVLATHEIEDALAFADEMIVIKEGNIIQTGEPASIYKKPANEYVANLFGEINIFSKEEFPLLSAEINSEKILVYPHQFIIGEEGMKVKVLKSYFSGNGYLIEAIYNMKKLWFKSPYFIHSGDQCHLEIIDYQEFSN